MSQIGEKIMTVYILGASEDAESKLPRIIDCSGNKLSTKEGMGARILNSTRRAIDAAIYCFNDKAAQGILTAVHKGFEITVGCSGGGECGMAYLNLKTLTKGFHLYGNPYSPTTICGCAHGTILHELQHLGIDGDECQAYVCTKECLDCARDIPTRNPDCSKVCCGRNKGK